MTELALTDAPGELEAVAPDLSENIAGALAATGHGGLSGREKAATLLVSLGPERAAKIFACLGEGEIEALSLEMTRIEVVDPEHSNAVLQEVAETAMIASWAGSGGFDYARDVLEKAVGEARAQETWPGWPRSSRSARSTSCAALRPTRSPASWPTRRPRRWRS